MATGETRTIDSDLILTNKYEMTAYDDILNIIGATVTLSKPAGDIFTNEGNDTVTITDSTITTADTGMSFQLGSGDDTLNLQNSTIDAPILTGSGNDVVVITGDKQSKVTLKNQTDEEDITLNLGANDDILELQAILEGDGDISFGTGTDTLRFNGGSLLTTGTLGTFTNLDVMVAGGTLGRDLTLAGDNTQIILNGALFGSSAGKVINIADSTTTLTTADNIRTDVTLNLSNITLTQSNEGTLEFSGHTGYAITANDSIITLHDIVTRGGGFTGQNTQWNIKNSNFSQAKSGMLLTSGTLDMRNTGMADYTESALNLNGTKLTGAQLAFTNNKGEGAVWATNTDLDVDNLRMNGNSISNTVNANATATNTAMVTANSVAEGGGLCHLSGNVLFTSATFSGNIVNASVSANAMGYTYNYNKAAIATAQAAAQINVAGGGIKHSFGDLVLNSANFLGNIASAYASSSTHAYASTSSKTYAYSYGYSTASAAAAGGGISHISGNLTLTNANFSGNIADVTATATASAYGYVNVSAANFSTRYYDKGYVTAIAHADAAGGGISHCSGNLTISNVKLTENIASAYASNSASNEGYLVCYTTSIVWAVANGGSVSHVSGDLTLDNVDITGNIASAVTFAKASAYYSAAAAMASAFAAGGGISHTSGKLTLSNANFFGNIATATATGSAWAYSRDYRYPCYTATASTTAIGGAAYIDNAIANFTNTNFTDNIANSSASAISTQATSYGGALYLSQTTMNYTVTSGIKLSNTGNQAQYGGWLYMADNSTANLLIEDKAKLTIGDSTNNDSIAGTGLIQKQGTGYLLINSDISDYTGVWTVYEGTLELARIARTITLDNWTFGEKGLVILSNLDDTINMTANKKISTLDLGGGSDVINTNGYTLSNGELRVSKLKFTGGGVVSSTITNRSTDSGFDLTLDDVILNSDINGGNMADQILITNTSTLGGAISLGNGDNIITGTAAATFQKTLSAGSGNDTLSFSSVSFEDTVILGAGNDILSIGNSEDNSGSVTAKKTINLGDGDNSITSYGTAEFAGITGGSSSDTIDLYKESSISGELDLGGGENVVYVEDTLTMNGAVKMTEGGETRIIVYRGTTLTDNSLTVYSDESAARDAVTMSWANQTELDKVRLVVSSDSTFETFEFAVELYNKSKSFTLNLEKGYFLQFQANDEDGWKQRLLDDTVAPDQVTGVEFNGSTLTWDVTHDNLGGNGVKQYTVEMATDSSFTTVIDTRTVTETEYVPQGLGDGTYYFRVCAEDYTQNIGEWSTTVSGILDSVAPTRPAGGQSSVNGYNVTFSWNAATDTGSGVAEYEYRIASDSSYSTIIRNDTTETLTVTENDLAYGTYYWQVRAIDNAGNIGEWSLSKSVKTQDLIAPSTPGNVDYGVEGSTVTVLWDGSKDDALGSGMKGYEVQLSNTSDFSTIVKSVSATETEALISNLAGGDYYMRVGAVDNVGNYSTWSSTLNFTIDNPDVTPPTDPSNLTVTVDNQDAILSWTASIDDQSGVAGYTIYYSLGSEVHSVTTADTSYTLTDLDAGTWSWSVFATDNAGNKSGTVIGDDFKIKTGVLKTTVTGDFAGIGKDYLGKEGDTDSILHIYQTGAEWGNTTMEDGWKFYDSLDFNGDGKADLLRSNADSKLVVGEVSNGNGTFTPQVLIALGDGWQILGTGDFNGNGYDDVLVANPTAASETVGLLGYWEGGTTWNLINGYSAEWEMVSTNDFNGDGKTDMLWKNSFTGEGGKTCNAYCTWIVDNANDWRMVSVANPDEWTFLCSGDFDGDNTADIAMINGEGVVGIWGINDGYLSSWSILSAVDTNTWNFAGAGDFDGDGTDDIAWCNTDTNLTGYWQINDKQLSSWQTIGTLA